MDRIRVTWSGMPGGPGVSTFYADDATVVITPLHSFFSDNTSKLPSDVAIQVEASGDKIDPADGKIVGAWSGDAQSPLQGSDGGRYLAPAGFFVRWLTSSISDGHRIHGRTFFVPAAPSQFQTNGALDVGAQAAIQTTTDSFRLAVMPHLLVWHRPFKGRAATPTRPARPAHVGAAFPVTGSSVGHLAAVLRSRRD